MSKQLAIIIPAYKDTFLRAALDSIAAQTCQDFTLYIGDDCSPYDIGDIVAEYKDKIDLVYQRFETNLGGHDLVAQWERCIAMSKDEPYLWLFSDDDVMEASCVEEFYKVIQQTKEEYDVYHFNVKVIDDYGEITNTPQSYPTRLHRVAYYKGKMSGKYMSLVVENIFKRSVYTKEKGFQNFDLAWGSDTATWIKFMGEKGMYTIPTTFVHWRSGQLNISPNNSHPMVKRKVKALTQFFNWVYSYLGERGTNVLLTDIRAFASRMASYRKYVANEDVNECISQFCIAHNCIGLKIFLRIIIKMK